MQLTVIWCNNVSGKPVSFSHLANLKNAPHLKVTAVLKGRTDSNGQQPIQIRIAHGEDRSFRPTRIRVLPSQFVNSRVTGHPKAKEYNAEISRLIIQYQAQALEGIKKKTPRTDFYAFYLDRLPHLDRKPATLRYYSSQIEKLKAFRPAFNVDQVDHAFLDQYKSYLKGIGNEGNTIWAAFKFLKTFVKLAKKQGIVDRDPFDSYENPRYRETDKNFLTENDLSEIDKFAKDEHTPANLREAAYWFLIACNTGLRISDLKAFNKDKHIIGGRLIIRTQKARELVGLPISETLEGYFKAVGYKKLSIHENTYNGLLKVIAAACGINKHVTTHTARHTTAMRLANAGVSQEVTARILGHRDLRATACYYKISNQRVDMEMKKLK